MDRHPQQIKRERQDKKRRARNVDGLSRLRTHVKKVLSATTKSDAELVYGNAVRVIDKAVNKNLIHKNTGGRRKAQITRHLNSLS
jgi:small subunit ribosomal protein S20|tara:strand:+ start:235 stop:489 length:255 start_codon:yes stop_codon:yes gene_type:complete